MRSHPSRFLAYISSWPRIDWSRTLPYGQKNPKKATELSSIGSAAD
jgi:hypothetical protein